MNILRCENNIFIRVYIRYNACACSNITTYDSSITNVRANDLNPILSGSRVKKIYCNGTASYRLYRKYIQPLTNIEAAYLPSSSPANAAWSLDRLIDTWGNILNS